MTYPILTYPDLSYPDLPYPDLPYPAAASPTKDIKKQQDAPLLIQGLPANIVAVASGAVFNLVGL